MPVPILMPALSPTMETGKLAKWHVKEGDPVQPGDIIAEIETDKATMEVEAIEEGRIGKLFVEESSDDIPVNTKIAVILTDDEEAGASVVEETPPPPKAPKKATEESVINTPVSAEKPEAPHTPAAAQSKMPDKATSRVLASPLAKRLAADHQLNLTDLTGSGPRGRIVKADIEQALKSGTAPSTISSAVSKTTLGTAATVAGGLTAGNTSIEAAKPPAGLDDKEIYSLYEEGSYDVVPHENMRRVIADRLTLAKTTIPHFYLSIDCELDELLSARKRMNEAIAADGVRLSVNDFIIKALALALQRVPDANATWSGQGMLKHKRSDIAVAVAVEGGLFTPVVRHADLKTLSEISNEMKDLAHRARNKKLAPHEYQGGTTSISNLGMYDIKQFDAVINPPHASILAVGRGEQRPVVKNDELTIANVMSCSLSCDHRVIDGALGAELLKAFKTYIEEPVTMLV